MRQHPDLTHSFLGAELARVEFGINDSEILNAIAYHTTGRKKMSRLEKLLYVADMIEPNREPYRVLNELRALARKNLDDAFFEGLHHKIEYTNKKKKHVHPLSKEALEYYTKVNKEEKYD
jgi:nicotinate-nucleotide adenylyltransferase